jgi:hypothetical protein
VKLERLAGSGDELYNDVRNAACRKIYGLHFSKFYKFSLFLYFGFSLRPYQETALGLPVVVRVPQFDKS